MKKILLKTVLLALPFLVVNLCKGQTLKANFTYSIDSTHCTTVYFQDSSVGNPHSFYWNYGDGNLGYNNQNTHTYYSNSIFTISLYIFLYDSLTNSLKSDTISKQIDLSGCSACLLKAIIEFDGDSSIPYSRKLYNISLGTINKHRWIFGDGGTSNAKTPVHSYSNPGTYTITYIAFDTIKNCSDTARIPFMIDSFGILKRQAFTVTIIDKTKSNINQVNLPASNFLKLYPNPASGYFKLEGHSQQINIYDIKGSKIATLQLNEGEILNIPTGNWPKGLYLILGENRERLKLIIE